MSSSSLPQPFSRSLHCILNPLLFRSRLDSFKLNRRTQLRIVELKVLILRRYGILRYVRDRTLVILVVAEVVGLIVDG